MSGIEFTPDTPETRKRFNDLARHAFVVKVYNEILADMQVCDIEGWNKLEFVDMLFDCLNHFRRAYRKERE